MFGNLLPVILSPSIGDSNFRLTRVDVNLEPMVLPEPGPYLTDNCIIYDLDVPPPDDADRDEADYFPHIVRFQFEVRQSKKFGFVAANVKYLTNGLSVYMDYSAANFRARSFGA